MQYLTEFVTTLNVGDTEKGRYTKDITTFLESGKKLEDFISALSATRKNAKTLDATRKRIERYLSWVEDKERSKKLPMENENEQEQITTPVENEHVQEVTTSEVEKSNAGRKRLDADGEKRSEKFMVYLTPTLANNIKAWCDCTGLSYGDFASKLFNSFFRDKEEKLNKFLTLRDELRRFNN